jgi:hypothetical protein
LQLESALEKRARASYFLLLKDSRRYSPPHTSTSPSSSTSTPKNPGVYTSGLSDRQRAPAGRKHGLHDIIISPSRQRHSLVISRFHTHQDFALDAAAPKAASASSMSSVPWCRATTRRLCGTLRGPPASTTYLTLPCPKQSLTHSAFVSAHVRWYRIRRSQMEAAVDERRWLGRTPSPTHASAVKRTYRKLFQMHDGKIYAMNDTERREKEKMKTHP